MAQAVRRQLLPCADPGGAGQATHQLPQVALAEPPAADGGQQRPGRLPDNPHIGVIGPSRSGKDYYVRRVILDMARPLAKAVVLDVKPFHARGPTCAPD